MVEGELILPGQGIMLSILTLESDQLLKFLPAKSVMLSMLTQEFDQFLITV